MNDLRPPIAFVFAMAVWLVACSGGFDEPDSNAQTVNPGQERDTGADTHANISDSDCDVDTDCPMGQVCTVSNECIEASCDFCTDDQICYVTEQNPEGSCSAPECTSNHECPDQDCIDGICGPAPQQDQNGDENEEEQNTNQQPAECPPCDSNEPGTCDDPTPYCIDDCCVECIGAADCTANQACIDGVCEELDDCHNDADCPNAYTCVGDTCQAPETGQSCDPEDTDDCPDGQYCSWDTETCEALGGENDCGLCNVDCTCPHGLECRDYFCYGCDFFADDCPEGQSCMALSTLYDEANVCVPF